MSGGRRSAEFAVEVGADRTTAFDFFSRVDNLNRVTPAWFRLDPVAPPPDLRVGAVIDYRFHWRLLRMRWRTRITVWRPPELFTYEQERGPYRFFRHEHRFEQRGRDTLMTDVVHYSTLGGTPADRWIVGPELARIFAYRAGVARELFPPRSSSRIKVERAAMSEPV